MIIIQSASTLLVLLTLFSTIMFFVGAQSQREQELEQSSNEQQHEQYYHYDESSSSTSSTHLRSSQNQRNLQEFNITLAPTVTPGPDTCTALDVDPCTTEYLKFEYEGDFPIDNVTEILLIDEAAVLAYDDLINCTQLGAVREVFDAEFLAINFTSQEFLLRVGVYCNSCGSFDCFEPSIDLFFETNGTFGNPEDDETTCDCVGPDVDEYLLLINEYLDFIGLSEDINITFVEQLCRIPDCIPDLIDDDLNGTTFDEEGVCLNPNQESLVCIFPSEVPSEFPSEFPSSFPSEFPTTTPAPTGTDAPTDTPSPTESTPDPTASPVETPIPTPSPTVTTPNPTATPTGTPTGAPTTPPPS